MEGEGQEKKGHGRCYKVKNEMGMRSSSSHIRSGRGAKREEVADREGSGAWTERPQLSTGRTSGPTPDGRAGRIWPRCPPPAVLNRPLQAPQGIELVVEKCLFYFNGSIHSSMHFYALFNLYLAPTAQFRIIADKKAEVVSFIVPRLPHVQSC